MAGLAASAQAIGRTRFAGVPKAGPASRWSQDHGSRRLAGQAARRVFVPRFLGALLVLTLFLATGIFGAVRGGAYAAFVERNGPLRDVLARAFGFGITVVEVNGARRLSNAEVVAAAGLDGRGSLLFADVEKLRERLKSNPMIAEASVRKLYPHSLWVSITERRPFALWQKDGDVSLVAADGTPIDELRDERYVDLPLVVGERANEKVKAFAALLDTQPSLKPLVRAGNWISQRRWELELKDGMMVELPEAHPGYALALFAGLMREYKLAERAVILVDLRLPDRVAFRLTEEAASQRAEELKKKLPPPKGEPG